MQTLGAHVFRLLLGLALALAMSACGGNGDVGSSCSSNGDCRTSLQCVTGTCAPKCAQATDCGDGYSCDIDGFCHAGSAQIGSACSSEGDCETGLSCQLGVVSTTNDELLTASCLPELVGAPPGAACNADSACRNGTCALGHCVDLCRVTRDCAAGEACMTVPRVEAVTDTTSPMFNGCLPGSGTLIWTIPDSSPASEIDIAVPGAAKSVTLTMSIASMDEQVGATAIRSPTGTTLFELGDALTTAPGASFYAQPVRQWPGGPLAVLTLPSTPDTPLVPGSYRADIQSFQFVDGVPATGLATPTLTAIAKLDTSAILDLHFFLLDLADHPCSAQLGPMLNATNASTNSGFESEMLSTVRALLASAGIQVGTITYDDISGHPDLDGLEISDVGSLLALGSYPGGINIFLVRTLSPPGIEAIAPNPGPVGLAGTSQSGIVISMDTVCYRSWTQVGRLLVHEIAHYMGLYDNVGLDGVSHDPISDDDVGDPTTNLMFYSDLGGVTLSAEQRQILMASAVLR